MGYLDRFRGLDDDAPVQRLARHLGEVDPSGSSEAHKRTARQAVDLFVDSLNDGLNVYIEPKVPDETGEIPLLRVSLIPHSESGRYDRYWPQ